MEFVCWKKDVKNVCFAVYWVWHFVFVLSSRLILKLIRVLFESLSVVLSVRSSRSIPFWWCAMCVSACVDEMGSRSQFTSLHSYLSFVHRIKFHTSKSPSFRRDSFVYYYYSLRSLLPLPPPSIPSFFAQILVIRVVLFSLTSLHSLQRYRVWHGLGAPFVNKYTFTLAYIAGRCIHVVDGPKITLLRRIR